MSKVEYPDEWSESTFDEISLFIGRGISPNYSESQTSTIAINQKCIRNGTVYTEFGRFQNDKISVRNSSILQTGDVCINSTGDGTIGRVGLWNKESLSNTYFVDSHVTIARPIEGEFDSKYLCELLSSDWIQSDLERFCFTGSTNQIELSRSELLKLRFHYPEFVHQQKIAKVLSTIDNQIEQTQALIEKYTVIKQGMMSDLFSRGIDANTGKLRPSYQQAPELFWKSDLGWIPEGWDCLMLSDVCNKITDGSHQSVKTVENEEIPFLFVSCIRDGNILWEKSSRISKSDYEVISKGREPKYGDILYTAVGSYGYAALVESDKPFAFQRHIAYIKPNPDLISSGFLVQYLNDLHVKKWADSVALGNAQKTVTLGELSKFPIIRPNRAEQEKIKEYLKQFDQKVSLLKTELIKLKSQKQGLMQDLLTGKKSVDSLPDSILTPCSSSKEITQ